MNNWKITQLTKEEVERITKPTPKKQKSQPKPKLKPEPVQVEPTNGGMIVIRIIAGAIALWILGQIILSL